MAKLLRNRRQPVHSSAILVGLLAMQTNGVLSLIEQFYPQSQIPPKVAFGVWLR